METRRLEYFLQIVDAGSISRAAALVGMAQPALSQQLAILEGELKARLLDRSPAGVTLTDAGQRVYLRAQSILRQIDGLKLEVAEVAGTVAGIVAVGLPPTLGGFVGVRLLARVRQEEPRIRLRIVEDGAAALAAGLQGGLLDMAIYPVRLTESNLEGVELLQEELFVMSAPHLRPHSVERADLARLPWIVTSSPNAIRAQLQALLARSDAEPNIVAEVNSLPLVIEAVRQGLGVTLLPCSPVAEALAAGEIVATPLGESPRRRTVMLYQRTDHLPTPAERVVRRMILELTAAACPPQTP